jgi:2-polyprenyl-6-methoxyphenol hydroxylase-like FAD-dependent oxidoreductase
MSLSNVLVVGAGPTGLAAALFLRLRGLPVRIIDQAGAPASTSRALAVNPRTLELLEESGVTQRMVATGRALEGALFYQGWRPLARMEFGRVHPRFRMLVLSQARSEQFLAEALAERGIFTEHSTELETLEQDAGAVRVTLALAGAVSERTEADFLFGADGAHSRVREALGLGFEGSDFPEAWALKDVELDTGLDLWNAHISFAPQGFVFLLAIEGGIWRVLGNVPDPLAYLPPGSAAGATLWETSFHIAHRVATAAAVGRVALGGDAAHVHSPVGGRGMNLGIEDGYAFADWLEERVALGPAALGSGALADYGRTRHALHRQVVRRVELLTRIGRGRGAPLRVIRRVLFPLAAGWAPTAQIMQRAVTGLDHEIRGH